MIKKNIPYKDQDFDLEGFVAYSAEEKRPLVIFCHAWRGRDEFICQQAERAASLGYIGFAIDMYGKGVLGKSKEENAALKKTFLDDRLLLKRRLIKGFDVACSLPSVDCANIAVVGFGFGGLCALDLARSGVNLKGVISVYGHFDPPRGCPIYPIKAKVLILHGFNDPISPMSELLQFQQEMDKDQVNWQAHIYSHTVHAFATPSANDPAAGILQSMRHVK
jgi:dienelactone hydrolase